MAEMKVPQTVPAEYGGKWITWNEDGNRIVGVGNTPAEAKAEAERAGEHNVVYEWVPPSDERFIGERE